MFSVHYGGKVVNCVPLPLNCLLVVLITVQIDAEIEGRKKKSVATGEEREANPESRMADKRLLWRTYGDGTALKSLLCICPPAPHGRVRGAPAAGAIPRT